MNNTLKDVVVASRFFRRNPGFVFSIVATVALSISAATIVFSLADVLVIHPWSVVADSPRLVWFFETNGKLDLGRDGVASANFEDWKRDSRSFDHMVSLTVRDADISAGGHPEHAMVSAVSPDYFDALGVPMELGRGLTASSTPDSLHTAVISHEVWQQRYGGRRDVLGKTLVVDGESYQVVGVAPPGFSFIKGKYVAWLPLVLSPEAAADREHKTLSVIGHISALSSPDQAQAEMHTIASRLSSSYPKTNEGTDITLVPIDEMFIGPRRAPVILLLCAVAFILLIACANVANLLLVRSTFRHRDAAIRLALGASPSGVVRQYLVESTLLSLLGGVAGIILSWWGIDALVAALPADLVFQVPRIADARLNVDVLLFALAATIGCGVVFGLAPALRIAGTAPAAVLKDGDRTSTAARGKRLRDAFVIVELALATVLLSASALSINSLAKALNRPLGFATKNVLASRFTLSSRRYKDDAALIAFEQQLLNKVGALPSVASASIVSDVATDSKGMAAGFSIEGEPPPMASNVPYALYSSVSADYFQSMDIRILAGRSFQAMDTKSSPSVVVISQSAANRFFAGRTPLGLRIRWVDDQTTSEIVGVVSDVEDPSNRGQGHARVYVSQAQIPVPSMVLLVRSAAEAPLLTPGVRGVIETLDPEQPIDSIEPMESVVAESRSAMRVVAWLLTILGQLALALAAIGIYGTVAYSVAQRRQELAIRIALGATPRDVLRLVLVRGIALSSVGIIVGLIGAWFVGKAAMASMAGIHDVDAIPLLSAAAVLFTVSLIACYYPARAAAAVDPLVALRSE